jgi:predicted nucleic acid-binding protein
VATGLTFDTGMLIALERRRRRAEEFLLRAREQRIVPVVPADVVVEWWRGRTDRREAILALVNVEPLSPGLARVAGEALAAVRGATAIDAVVMASAASRGDVVLTSDLHDLERLRSYFPSVRVLEV